MDTSHKRQQERVAKRLKVRYGAEAPNNLGFVKNLSRSGVAIAGRKIFNPNSRLILELELDDGPLTIAGVVRWRAVQLMGSVPQGEMGVMFLERSERYLALLGGLISELGEKRVEPRIDKVLKLTLESPRPLIELYTSNVSKGGLFVVSDDPVEPGSLIVLKLYILDLLDVITVECRVVRTIYRAQAREQGCQPGMGVEFVKFHGDSQKLFLSYVERLKAGRKMV